MNLNEEPLVWKSCHSISEAACASTTLYRDRLRTRVAAKNEPVRTNEDFTVCRSDKRDLSRPGWKNLQSEQPETCLTVTTEESHVCHTASVSTPHYFGPTKRWGHSCVAAWNCMFLIGGYHGQYIGDVWVYCFSDMSWFQVPILPTKQSY